jgi:hypothetical protein
MPYTTLNILLKYAYQKNQLLLVPYILIDSLKRVALNLSTLRQLSLIKLRNKFMSQNFLDMIVSYSFKFLRGKCQV